MIGIFERLTYPKSTTVQTDISSMFEIIMTAGGYPTMGQLNSMVYFHLPLASMEETVSG